MRPPADANLPAFYGAEPRPPWAGHVLVGLGATAAITAVFWLTDLDLRAQALAYSPVEPHWPYARLPGFEIFYHLGTLPGLALGLAAAVGLGLSFTRSSCVRWRYPCLFLVLLMALGPGLVINVLAKGFGGRPRPDQIVQFGGLLEFRHPFEPGFPHRGFSFLCGHCSMGFMFMGLYFLLRRWQRWAFLAGGLAFGLAQGAGRMVQGAHFASDALLGASIMFTLAAALSPVAARPPKTGAERRHRLRVAGATALLVVLIVGFFLFSVGMRQEETRVWLEPGQVGPPGEAKVALWRPTETAPEPREIVVAVEVGNVTVELRRQPEPMLIRSLVTAYAFPGSSSDITVGELEGYGGISYRQSLSGLFIEKNGTFVVSLREDTKTALRVSTGGGDIILAAPRPPRPLVVSGSFQLSDPGAILKATGPGSYAHAGEGRPIVLTLTAGRVFVQP